MQRAKLPPEGAGRAAKFLLNFRMSSCCYLSEHYSFSENGLRLRMHKTSAPGSLLRKRSIFLGREPGTAVTGSKFSSTFCGTFGYLY